MKFGNWEVTENAIEWKGAGLNRFVINTNDLAEEIETDDENLSLYKWIVLATEEEGLSEDDLYDLNFAFVYAAAKTGVEFDYQMFDETLSYQYSQLEDDEDEQPADDELADLEQQRKEAESERD